MPPKTEAPMTPDQNSMILGEMRGQLREMVHSVNNLNTKFDALTREVVGLAAVAAEIGKLQAKVEALEADKNRKDGERGIVQSLMRSPSVAWLVVVLGAAWAALTGKLHV